MESIKWLELIQETLKEKKELRETYLNMWQNAWFFETIELSNKQIIYKHPSLVDSMIVILDNLYTSYPNEWKSMIPELTNPADAKKWMIQQHIKQIQTKKEGGKLKDNQQSICDRELQTYNDILAKAWQWNITTMPGIDLTFMPLRRLEAKNKNPDILPHKIISHAIDFIPNKKQSLMQNLLNDNVKQFVETHKNQIEKVGRIIKNLDIEDPEQQANIFENLVHCQLDENRIKKIVELGQSCKASGDYYELIIAITDIFMEDIQKTKTLQNDRIINSVLNAKESIKKDLRQRHEGWRKFTIKQLTRPNLDIALPWYIHIADMLKQYPKTKITDLLRI